MKGQKWSKEVREKISKSVKECHKRIPNYGMKNKKHTAETKRKIGDANRNRPSKRKGKTYEEIYGKERTLEEINKRREKKIGQKRTKIQRIKMSKAHLKTNEPVQLDLVNYIRGSREMKIWRTKVFKRDNYTCQNCGIKSGCGKAVILNAHHIKMFIDILRLNKIKTENDAFSCKELWDINNGITLCLKCHNKTKNGRKN